MPRRNRESCYICGDELDAYREFCNNCYAGLNYWKHKPATAKVKRLRQLDTLERRLQFQLSSTRKRSNR